MDIRTPNPTRAATILRRFLAESGIEIKHTTALEAVARVSGYSSWQAMAADHKNKSRTSKAEPLLRLDPAGDDESDFEYVDNPGNRGAWVGIGTVSVYLNPTDEGVVVDLFARGGEDCDSLASTYLFYQEALDALCERSDVELEAVEAWAKAAHGLEFASQSWSRKAELIREFCSQPTKLEGTAASTGPGPVPLEKRYVHGEWEHIFFSRPVKTRFVFDRCCEKIVYMQVRENDYWRPASHMDIADVQDSVLNANEAIDNPAEYGLTESDEPPQWALAFVRPEKI